MSITSGTVNERLVPVVSVSLEKEGNDWQDLDMLLDTGFDGEIALFASLLNRHRLATQPPRQLLHPEVALERWDNWGPSAPYKLNVRPWWGNYPEASLHLLHSEPESEPDFSGLLGTKVLEWKVVTMDVTKGGKVSVDSASSRPEPRRRKRRSPSMENWDEYIKWSGRNIPWTNLPVQDRNGIWRNVWVNVDTGDNGELSLPTSWIDELGLTLPGKAKVCAASGPETVSIGEAKVKWQGKERLAECRHRKDCPPLVGMKLLEGYRVTMDFTYSRPLIEMGRIPRSAWSDKGFFASLTDTFRI